MTVSFRQLILLYCLKRINGERTIYSIYHLFQGKKSSQTIQDAHLFQLGVFFHSDTGLSRMVLEEAVAEFVRQGFIVETSNQRFILTEKGESTLEKSLTVTPVPAYINGWKYDDAAHILWERLSLAIQVISHLQKNESKYLPVQKKPDTLLWMKLFLKKHHLNRELLAEKLYIELVTCLESDPSIDPNLFVIRLSGFRQVGLTELQAAQKMGMEPSYYHYQFLNIIHYLVAEIEKNEGQFPILAYFLDRVHRGNLTQSTEKTFSLLKQGCSIDDVISIRRLKQSTIEDHLVELALHIPEFSIDEYVTIKKQAQIQQAIIAAKTKQLKEIRKFVEQANYFEIRLVLAKYGDNL